jgi:lipopolysaccharide/colanic/teichoic acid biosynthesis glycosyltransferase
MLSPATVPEIRRISDAHEIRLDFIPELIGLQRLQPPMEPSTTVEAKEPTIAMPEPAQSSYFVLKRFLELLGAVTVLVLFLPFWVLLGTVALCDVGSPISFWQQRLGQGGCPFLLHKIRTLKPPFDWRRRCQKPSASQQSVASCASVASTNWRSC